MAWAKRGAQSVQDGPRKSELLQVYLGLVSRGELPVSEGLRKALVKKASKSESGVLVITVLTSPHPEYTDPDSKRRVRQAFSCEWNCYYCPDEPGQPRSYLHDEPSVLRANMNQFDPGPGRPGRPGRPFKRVDPFSRIWVVLVGQCCSLRTVRPRWHRTATPSTR